MFEINYYRLPDQLNRDLSELSFMADSPVDQKLADAAREVLLTGRLTPLIKEELKCKIQSRRLSMGQDEMEVNFEAPRRYQVGRILLFK